MARKLARLTPLGQQIMSLLLNAVAFGTHGSVGNVDSLAEPLKTTSGRLRPVLRKLVHDGYLTIEGKIAESVYPTVAALRWREAWRLNSSPKPLWDWISASPGH